MLFKKKKPDSTEKKGNETPKEKRSDFFDSVVIAFVIAMIIRTFLIQAYKIPTGSMLDTLLIGDHLIVDKLTYKIREPKFGEVFVFQYPIEPDKDYIKRVIGTPGDRIKIVDKVLYRNGVAVEEKYVKFSRAYSFMISELDNIPEFTVPQGRYFAMGDNRDSSFDSRYWGFVDGSAVKGKAWFIYWSWDSDGTFFLKRIFTGGIRFDRILSRVH